VWLGFAFLVLGTMICLIPQSWVDMLSPPRKTRIGRLGEAAALLLVAGGITFGMTQVAMAQGPAQPQPQAPAEYEDEMLQTAPSHNSSGAHLYREDDAEFLRPFRERAEALVAREAPGLKPGDAEFKRRVEAKIEPIVAVVTKTMARMTCMCGCTHETLYDCKCGLAAQERQKVLQFMAGFDLLTEAGRTSAMDSMWAAYRDRFGGQNALIVPDDEGAGRLAWLVPYVLVAAGLGLVFAAARRWIKRGRSDMADEGAAARSAESAENEGYAELLDDELRDTD
jgi:cytochrome c-type biogenesis protein CcmH/NrfF